MACKQQESVCHGSEAEVWHQGASTAGVGGHKLPASRVSSHGTERQRSSFQQHPAGVSAYKPEGRHEPSVPSTVCIYAHNSKCRLLPKQVIPVPVSLWVFPDPCSSKQLSLLSSPTAILTKDASQYLRAARGQKLRDIKQLVQGHTAAREVWLRLEHRPRGSVALNSLLCCSFLTKIQCGCISAITRCIRVSCE